jgi:sterol desaturase/sphingolipid hydroxylase (fatty acid hydroxylase superfamily)
MKRPVKAVAFLGLLALSTLAWYSGGPTGVEDRIVTLANHPEARTAFQDPESGRSDAMVTLVSFAVLTPLAAGVAATIVIFAIKAFETVLAVVRLPAWLSAPIVIAAVVTGVYATTELWMPNSLYAAGMVSRAYLVYSYGAVPVFH